MSKIIDLIPYCGENDLLELRLFSLRNIVHQTILLESNLSHTLIPKPLFFMEVREKFSQFNIKYFVKDFNYENPFHADWAGRVALLNEVEGNSNILIHSDLDEIPNPEKLQEAISNLNRPTNLRGDYFFWVLDLWGRKSNDAIILRQEWIRDSFYKYRDARNGNFFKRVDNASYHYSSVGTPEQIARKWTFFAHANEVDNKYKNSEYIIKQIKRKTGSWDENAKDNELILVEHKYPNLPQYLLDNKEKYKHLFWEYYKNL